VHRLPFSSTIRAFHAAISGRFARMMRSSPVMVIEVLSSINQRCSFDDQELESAQSADRGTKLG
jgi:hypothetical protein